MKAYRWLMVAPGEPLSRTEFEPASPQANEVLIEIAGCGVCHTDLGFYYDGVRTKHPLPLALGHEISGRVIAAGSDAAKWRDKSVIVPAVIPCAACDLCQRGRGTICRKQVSPGIDMHGGFASHITVPSAGLCEIDPGRLAGVGMELADASVIADALTTPYQAVLQAEVQPGDLAVVIGVGGVGGYAVQLAHARGATVVAIDVDQAKLEQLRDFGATLLIDAREVQGKDLRNTLRQFAQEQGLRQTEWKIFECSGTAAGQQSAFALLTYGACLSVVGFTMDKIEVRLSNLMAFHARALGNWGCLPEHYPDAAELVLSGKVSMLPFVERHPLSSINEIFASAHAGELRKRAILVPDE
ncbi:MAG: alcohol dehydrogenase catalytic domain-containing protein [Gammaproteobacteria bacterium]|nr:MAG: alcohol dehydrogenase catalytic domain-containing protein [Gammaproteobacteria bacterium]